MAALEFKSKSELENWARALAPQLRRPCVVLLSGNLGAGKTQTVRWFCAALGVTDAASPTFAIHNEYSSPGGPVDHVDLYRVKSDADLEASGFWDLLANPAALLFVEWADRLPADVWPSGWTQVSIQLEKSPAGEGARNVNLVFKKP